MRAGSFYITGGTVPRDAACYVTRRADEELLQGLTGGEFCYVLTSRQMGKSSLMVRTAQRLREDGATVVVLDLTALGQNLTAEQWYGGLFSNLARQVGREDELEDRWDEERARGPLERFFRLITDEVLPSVEGRLVIFVDEIDVVRSLPFSTDEFFAAIRECYNRRTREPALERLTFCLLGVASPSDLIRDSRLTPFNIGRRIELSDFTPEEAYPLAVGLTLGAPGAALRSHDTGKALLRRVLHWTGGHPYLTQRLCQALNDAGGAGTTMQVDHLCEELFLQPRAQEKDDNLLFVRERLLRQEADENVDRVKLLECYRRVWRSERRAFLPRTVRDDPGDAAITKLQLAGIAASRAGTLRVRNRIYAEVFDDRWIAAQMPDAELQRQRAAFRRGVALSAGGSAVVITLLGALTAWALTSERKATANGKAAEQNAAAARRQAALALANARDANEQRRLAELASGRSTRLAHRLSRALQERQTSLDEAMRQRRKADTLAAKERTAAALALAEAERANLEAERADRSASRLDVASRLAYRELRDRMPVVQDFDYSSIQHNPAEFNDCWLEIKGVVIGITGNNTETRLGITRTADASPIWLTLPAERSLKDWPRVDVGNRIKVLAKVVGDKGNGALQVVVPIPDQDRTGDRPIVNALSSYFSENGRDWGMADLQPEDVSLFVEWLVQAGREQEIRPALLIAVVTADDRLRSLKRREQGLFLGEDHYRRAVSKLAAELKGPLPTRERLSRHWSRSPELRRQYPDRRVYTERVETLYRQLTGQPLKD